MKEKIVIARAQLTEEKVEKPESKAELDKRVKVRATEEKLKTDYSTDKGRLVLIRRAILIATEKFRKVNFPEVIEPEPEDKEICAALGGFASNPAFMNQMKVLTEAITKKKYTIAAVTSNSVKYNVLAAFVPLASSNGHSYPIGEVAVMLARGPGAGTFLRCGNATTGNIPPEQIKGGNGAPELRPATAEEIEKLSDKALLEVERNTGLVFVPVEV